MVPRKPTLGIRFDIDRVGSGEYGLRCWEAIWAAIDPETLEGSDMFEGDTAATLNGLEYTYCIAFQNSDASRLNATRDALQIDPAFQRISAAPMFVEDGEAVD